MISEFQSRITALSSTLSLLDNTTKEANRCCDLLTRRSRQLDSLTSPASDASQKLTRASQHLMSTIAIMKESREKFDTVVDVEPTIKRLHQGATSLMEARKKNQKEKLIQKNKDGNSTATNNSGGEGATPGANAAANASGTNPSKDASGENGGSAENGNENGKDGAAAQNDTTGANETNGMNSSMHNGNNPNASADDDNQDNNALSSNLNPFHAPTGLDINQYLTEQDVYSTSDSMETIREAYTYFLQRKTWRSTPSALGGLERVHQLGIDGMCVLVQSHFTTAGPAIQVKKLSTTSTSLVPTGKSNNHDFDFNIQLATMADPTSAISPPKETPKIISATKDESAIDTRKRISNGLQKRDLMKSVGEYEEFLPLDTRSVRELRAIFECLAQSSGAVQNPNDLGLDDDLDDLDDNAVDDNSMNMQRRTSRYIPNSTCMEKQSLKQFRVSASKVVRTEKIGGGYFSNLTKYPLRTGYPHLNAYGEARRIVAYAAMHGFHRHLRDERKKRTLARQKNNQSLGMTTSLTFDSSDIDSAARDAIRSLEHALVVVAGEKAIYKCVVSPTSSHTHDESTYVSEDYKEALLCSYNHVVASVVDKTLDIIETVFLKEAGIAMLRASNPDNMEENEHHDLVRIAGSGAAAGFRILDGVRMLGPSLSKLCEMGDSSKQQNQTGPGGKLDTVAGGLCICIHRLTVKNTAKVMENLAKAIQNDPHDGDKFRPPDASVAAVSSDVCWALSLISPFSNAYKSVTKRRALAWDTNTGNGASDMDSYVRYLVSRLLTNLQAKAEHYLNDDSGPAASARNSLFMMNNTFYLLEYQLKSFHKLSEYTDIDEEEYYVLSAPWFKDKVGSLFEKAKEKYLSEWDSLNQHLTNVSKDGLTYQNENLLSKDSGRLFKARFSGFIEDFEKTYAIHKELNFADMKLRMMLQIDVKDTFLPRYRTFFERNSKLQFSKKKMDEYLKYPPKRVEFMIDELFGLA